MHISSGKRKDYPAMVTVPGKDKMQRNEQKTARLFAVMQRADDPDIARARQQIEEDLRGGATGIAVIFAGAPNAWRFGLPARADIMEKLFDGIDLANLHIRIDNHPHGQALTEKCVEFLQKKRLELKSTQITFSIDPIAVLASTGRLKMSLAALKASLPQSMSAFFSSGLPGIVLEADGRPFHNAGASRAQEIGAMLAVAHSHLQMVEEGRHHIAYALPHIGFATALDQDPARNIAKMQVLQMLWHKLQKDHGIASPVAAPIHVETSMRMMTRRDCLTNISRATAAALAAIAGGAVSLSVLPYSLPLGLPNAQARRVARNCPLVFTRETAPTALISGSALTPNAALVEKLAAAAWEEFRFFEQQGGILPSLVNGSLIRRIHKAQELRLSAYLRSKQAPIDIADFAGTADKGAAIYAQKPVSFQAEGIEQCTPLTFCRTESLLAGAAANAPGETV
ncbi:hypothetical protein DPQ22_00545 [Candidatus Tokpelaia sp.]|nr:hypothetical protein DPQ22_00545 [Candidatus Tokpelaia sp.]